MKIAIFILFGIISSVAFADEILIDCTKPIKSLFSEKQDKYVLQLTIPQSSNLQIGYGKKSVEIGHSMVTTYCADGKPMKSEKPIKYACYYVTPGDFHKEKNAELNIHAAPIKSYYDGPDSITIQVTTAGPTLECSGGPSPSQQPLTFFNEILRQSGAKLEPIAAPSTKAQTPVSPAIAPAAGK